MYLCYGCIELRCAVNSVISYCAFKNNDFSSFYDSFLNFAATSKSKCEERHFYLPERRIG